MYGIDDGDTKHQPNSGEYTHPSNGRPGFSTFWVKSATTNSKSEIVACKDALLLLEVCNEEKYLDDSSFAFFKEDSNSLILLFKSAIESVLSFSDCATLFERSVTCSFKDDISTADFSYSDL